MGNIIQNINQGKSLSLKQDIEMVKEELNSEEKFFEKAVITEKFIKKYKNLMIGSVIALVVLVGANVAYAINKQNTLDEANSALLALQKNASNKEALTSLKSSSPALYDVWSYSQAIANKDQKALETLKNSKTALIPDLVAYELATDTKDLKGLEAYSSKEGAIYKDLATIQEAVILMQESKIEESHRTLSQISIQSPLAQIANALMHYGVK